MNQTPKANLSAVALVFLTVFLTVYGQLIIKWRVRWAGSLPADFPGKVWFLTRLLISPWVISGMIAAFLAGVSWLAAMTKLDLSYAYPFMSLALVCVVIFSILLFDEAVTRAKILGVLLIVIGIVVTSRG
jgi:multidrug transporter EmrE-like cation transporter